MSPLRQGSRCHAHTPTAGPIVGGAFPEGHHAPLAIAEQYYSTTCNGRKHIVSIEEVHKDIGSAMVDPITKAWVGKLSTIDDQCVEVAHGPDGGIFTWM